MLKAGDLARWEDHRVKGVKIGKTRRDRGISHVCPGLHSIIVCSNDDPGVTLTYFTARLNFVIWAFP